MLMPLLVLIMVVPSAMMIMFGSMDLTQRITMVEYTVIREYKVIDKCNYIITLPATLNNPATNLTYLAENIECGLSSGSSSILGCYLGYPGEDIRFGSACEKSNVKGYVLVSVGSCWFILILSCVLFCTLGERQPDVSPHGTTAAFRSNNNENHEVPPIDVPYIEMKTINVSVPVENGSGCVQLAKPSCYQNSSILVVVNP